MNEKRLERVDDDKVFLGVAGGIGRYFDIDPVIVRIIFVIAGLASAGHAVLAYLLLAMLMPQAQSSYTPPQQLTDEYDYSKFNSSGKAYAFDPDAEIIIKDA